MGTREPRQDPQDKAFGAAASRDQEIVDELEKRGMTEDELSDEPARSPRAAGKAEPAHAQGVPTGEDRARQNRQEEPPREVTVIEAIEWPGSPCRRRKHARRTSRQRCS